MAGLTRRIASRVKATPLVDQRVRYNRRHYEEVRDLLRALDTMGRDARRELSLRLTERALGWARQAPAGGKRSNELADWPMLDRDALAADYQRLVRPECSWLTDAAPGELAAPVPVYRSVRSIAAEQAFLDDLLGVWDFTFAASRIARLLDDDVKPPPDGRPPHGTYSNWGRTLALSSRQLGLATAPWYHAELRAFKPQVLHVEPATGAALTRCLVELGLRVNVPVVLVSAIGLEPESRRLMEDALGAIVIDYYCRPEGVVFAAGLAESAYYFNPGYGRVELLEAANPNAPPGCRTLAIVGTGFWNEAMSLVRYRTGDVALVPESYTAVDVEDVALGLKPVIAIRRDSALPLRP